MRLRDASCRGFTVLELVVVLGVAAILLAMMTMNGPVWLGHHRLAAAARQVVTDLRLVRAKAMAQTSPFRVTFTAGSGAYVVERADGGGGWAPHALYSKALVAGVPVPIDLPEAVRVAASRQIVFAPRGNANAPATVRLQVPALPGHAQVVDVSFTGAVRIH